ncbi:hypothetical protein J14TS2_31360 [Bacillus sp. J14TS2]|uniref:hypothetical protein n=1 Tax=Bacillus sp. J14TS2 TaxID=2807188 RepID=UPI001B1DAB33|nr:hypothetical protein [Bacillus sp. J14TS2]GIN72661.1 hypothetical protein J14TS2_31360 [Bacillus sp. J14TS2]
MSKYIIIRTAYLEDEPAILHIQREVVEEKDNWPPYHSLSGLCKYDRFEGVNENYRIQGIAYCKLP